MARKPVTAQAFADQLQAAGVRIVWRDNTEFDASHGKGTSARSATVCFFRDTFTFSHARSGAGSPLRSMTAVYRHLRLNSAVANPTDKTAPDLAADLVRDGAVITWHGDTMRNFTVVYGDRTVHVHCHDGKNGTGGRFNYGSGDNLVFESMAAVKQHLGLRKAPACAFAADLTRAGATIHWRDNHQFRAVHVDGGTEHSVTVVYNISTGRLRYGTAGIGVHLYTKNDIRRHLRLPCAV